MKPSTCYTLKAKFKEDFFNKSTPQLAYFLGFLWGDGYLYRFAKHDGTIVSIEILSSDMEKLFPYFDSACNWNHLKIKKKLSKNEFYRIYSGDRNFYDFLSSLGFSNKSGNQNLILGKLNKEHHRYFYRGLLDSDGSIGRYKGNCIITITSRFEQDWSSLENFCKEISVPYKIKFRKILSKTAKVSQFSQFEINRKLHFFKFLDELYKDALIDGLYLPRKFHKYLDIKRFVALGISDDVKNVSKSSKQT